MREVNLTCVECPMGCSILAQVDGNKVLSVTGNSCPRGESYAKTEVFCPMRVLTTTVRCENGKLLAVKTDKPIKKSNLFEAMKIVNAFKCSTQVKIGDILIKDFIDGANLIATDNLK